MRRIPALDGLRAVACLLVLAAHACVPYLRVGWVGVDVFFVLSGFLITGNLLHELEGSGRIALGRFWLRRLARLYPALVLAVPVAVIAGAATSAHAMVALSYLGDFGLANIGRAGLGHTWSLAVEEQFYLIWPIAVIAAGRRRLLPIIIATACGSMGYMLAGGLGMLSDERYRSPIGRTWELLLGCGLAVVLPRLTPSRWVAELAAAAAACGFAVVIVAGTVLWGAAAGEAVVAAVSGGCVIVAVSGEAKLCGWLEWPALRWVGERSYGIYLFHYPFMFTFQRAHPGGLIPIPLHLAVIPVVLAALSYRWVERPLLAKVRGWLESGDAPSAPMRVAECDDARQTDVGKTLISARADDRYAIHYDGG